MRVTYRNRDVEAYWRDRWSSIPVDEPMINKDVYPLKYVEMAMGQSPEPILEAGCGNGRILRHLASRGLDVQGMDFIPEAVDKLHAADPSLNVRVGDIRELDFENETFGTILAFGLYHNLDKGLNQAIQESHRVLKPGGRICASFRADNLHNQLSDWYADRSRKASDSKTPTFHKLNLNRSEVADLFHRNGFNVDAVFPVQNMSILYKLSAFRRGDQKRFDENRARVAGYQLSIVGTWIQLALMRCIPNQWCNVFVLIGTKKDDDE